jgi:hypothetical protein
MSYAVHIQTADGHTVEAPRASVLRCAVLASQLQVCRREERKLYADMPKVYLEWILDYIHTVVYTTPPKPLEPSAGGAAYTQAEKDFLYRLKRALNGEDTPHVPTLVFVDFLAAVFKEGISIQADQHEQHLAFREREQSYRLYLLLVCELAQFGQRSSPEALGPLVGTLTRPPRPGGALTPRCFFPLMVSDPQPLKRSTRASSAASQTAIVVDDEKNDSEPEEAHSEEEYDPDFVVDDVDSPVEEPGQNSPMMYED